MVWTVKHPVPKIKLVAPPEEGFVLAAPLAPLLVALERYETEKERLKFPLCASWLDRGIIEKLRR